MKPFKIIYPKAHKTVFVQNAGGKKQVLFIFGMMESIDINNFINIGVMSDLEEMRKAIVAFTKERDWDQFHDGKNLAIALSIEANELLESFLWKNAEDVKLSKVEEELADVFNYAILIANKYDLNIRKIVMDKLMRNAEKYPVSKCKGSAAKYNEL